MNRPSIIRVVAMYWSVHDGIQLTNEGLMLARSVGEFLRDRKNAPSVAIHFSDMIPDAAKDTAQSVIEAATSDYHITQCSADSVLAIICAGREIFPAVSGILYVDSGVHKLRRILSPYKPRDFGVLPFSFGGFGIVQFTTEGDKCNFNGFEYHHARQLVSAPPA